jgi:hypothetical protein
MRIKIILCLLLLLLAPSVTAADTYVFWTDCHEEGTPTMRPD